MVPRATSASLGPLPQCHLGHLRPSFALCCLGSAQSSTGCVDHGPSSDSLGVLCCPPAWVGKNIVPSLGTLPGREASMSVPLMAAVTELPWAVPPAATQLSRAPLQIKGGPHLSDPGACPFCRPSVCFRRCHGPDLSQLGRVEGEPLAVIPFCLLHLT